VGRGTVGSNGRLAGNLDSAKSHAAAETGLSSFILLISVITFPTAAFVWIWRRDAGEKARATK
jgi:hypothetical protein